VVGHTTLTVTRTTRSQWLVLAVLGVLGTAGLTLVLHTVTDSTVPLPDALTTVLSLLATWGQARKKAGEHPHRPHSERGLDDHSPGRGRQVFLVGGRPGQGVRAQCRQVGNLVATPR
jgi:hypothetical protein